MIATQVGQNGSSASSTAAALHVLNEASRTVAAWVRQAGCGLTGHEMIRRFEPSRVSLQCLNCGVETAGWTLRGQPEVRAAAPRFRLTGKTVDHAMA